MSDRQSLLAEQEFLLGSLEDLETELRAGDITEFDYSELKKDYTVRAARTARQLRRLDSGEGAAEARPAAPRRRWLWAGGLLLFGLAAGALLAFSVGERGVNDQITGTIEETPRQQVLRCQQMGQDPTMLVSSFECFDDVLARDPENAEAMAYRGWYGVLASGSAQQAGQDELATELLSLAGVFLDRAVRTDPTYPDARAFRMIVMERLGQRGEACDDAAALADLNPPEMIGQLTTPVVARLDCDNR